MLHQKFIDQRRGCRRGSTEGLVGDYSIDMSLFACDNSLFSYLQMLLKN